MNCLDSTFVVDFLDRESTHHDDAVEWLSNSDTPCATPAICVFEVLRGSARGSDEQFQRAVGFFRTVDVLDLNLDAAIVAGALDGDLHASGNPLSPRDTLVAAAAHENGMTLVTRDADFERVPDLQVVFYDRN